MKSFRRWPVVILGALALSWWAIGGVQNPGIGSSSVSTNYVINITNEPLFVATNAGGFFTLFDTNGNFLGAWYDTNTVNPVAQSEIDSINLQLESTFNSLVLTDAPPSATYVSGTAIVLGTNTPAGTSSSVLTGLVKLVSFADLGGEMVGLGPTANNLGSGIPVYWTVLTGTNDVAARGRQYNDTNVIQSATDIGYFTPPLGMTNWTSLPTRIKTETTSILTTRVDIALVDLSTQTPTWYSNLVSATASTTLVTNLAPPTFSRGPWEIRVDYWYWQNQRSAFVRMDAQ